MVALKDFFDSTRVSAIADQFSGAWPEFDSAGFIASATSGLDALELKARSEQIAQAMGVYLPKDFALAAPIVLRSLGEPLGDSDQWGMEVFHYLPHTMYVATHGANEADFDVAMALQQELTQRFSAEFSIRAFWSFDRERTIAWMQRWAQDPCKQVRRLVSEGTRPRLPWAGHLKDLIEDPTPALALLELLKDDPALLVRRSVANHLNDISKDHPQVVLETCARWLEESPTAERTWLVRHALRTLIKKGDAQALEVLGHDSDMELELSATFKPARVPLGGKTKMELVLSNTTDQTQRGVVDVIMHFVKANGQTSPKTFKLKEVEIEAGTNLTLRKTFSFAYHSTRTPYAGEHRLEAMLNGQRYELGTIEVF